MSSDEKKSYQRRGINNNRLNAILEHAGQSILDVGCGSGAYVHRLKGEYDIKGVDYQHFESWDESPELFGVSDASVLDFEDESIDTITSFETLEHIENPGDALKEYYRVCKKNVILTVPNCTITPGMKSSNMLYSHWVDRTHIQFFDLESISTLVTDAGFKIVKQDYTNKISILPLVAEAFGLGPRGQKWLNKLFRKTQKKDYFITCLIVGEK